MKVNPQSKTDKAFVIGVDTVSALPKTAPLNPYDKEEQPECYDAWAKGAAEGGIHEHYENGALKLTREQIITALCLDEEKDEAAQLPAAIPALDYLREVAFLIGCFGHRNIPGFENAVITANTSLYADEAETNYATMFRQATTARNYLCAGLERFVPGCVNFDARTAVEFHALVAKYSFVKQ